MKKNTQLSKSKHRLLSIRGLVLLLFATVFSISSVQSQYVLDTTVPPASFANNNGSGFTTFNFVNNNNFAVMITDVSGVSGTTAAAATAYLYTSATPVNGQPGVIPTASVLPWVQQASQTVSVTANTSTTALQPIITGASIIIPANTTVGMAIGIFNGTTGISRYSTITSATISNGGVDLIFNAQTSYGGGTMTSAGANVPRGFIGSITFIPAIPCTGAPVAGTATSSLATLSCPGQHFTLSLSGGTVAAGITYQWESAPAGTQNYSPINGATRSSHIVTNFLADTDYRCVVTCTSSNLSSTSNVVSMTQPTPTNGFYENFDGLPAGGSATPSLPQCWSYADNHTGYAYTTTTAARSGSGIYGYVPAATTGEILVISPTTNNLGNGGKQVRFWARVSSTSYLTNHQLDVLTMDGTTVSANKSVVQSRIPLTEVWQEFIVPLPQTTDDYFAFDIGSSNNTLTYIYIDDVYYEDVSPCIYPLGFTASNITATTVDLSWNASSAPGVQSYDYEVRDTTGAVVASGTTTNTNVSVSTLLPGTNYKAYIRSVCSSGPGIWTTLPVSFVTECVALTANFYEDFESTPTGGSTSNTVPTCWTYIRTGSTSIYGYTSTTAAQSGSRGFYTYRPLKSGTTYSGDLMLVSPETVNLGAGTKQIRFQASKYQSGGYYAGELKIYTLSDKTATASKTLIATINLPSNGSWQEYVVPLPNTTDDYFAFSFEEESTYKYIFIDDVFYENLAACMYPVKTTATNITGTSVTIGWEKATSTAVTGYDWEVRDMQGNVVKSGTIGSANTVSHNVTGLSSGTIYQFFVRSKCGANPGDWGFGHRFATTCGVVDYIYEGFELQGNGGSSSPNTPHCWTYLDNHSGYMYPYYYMPISGDFSYYGYIPTSTTTTMMLVSPETNNLGNGTKRLRFKASVESTTYVPYQKLEVYRLSDKTSVTTANATKTLIEGGFQITNSPQEFIVYLPAGVTDDYFAFQFSSVTGTTYMRIDDIYYEDIPPLDVKLEKKDIICYGAATGEIDSKVEGGKPPYTYLWTPTGASTEKLTGVVAGTYTLTITDARNISKSATITIDQGTQIFTNATSTNVSCFGLSNGSISINPSGGTGPYTVLWSDNFIGASRNNLAPGSYTFTVRDAYSCPVTETIVISSPSQLISSVTNQTNVSNFGGSDGSATINVIGGTIPYTYLWTPGNMTSASESNLPAGTYNVLITDANGCTSNQTIVITEPPIPYQIQLLSLSNVSCNGLNDGSINVQVLGGTPPYTYQWSAPAGNSPIINNLTPGLYSLTVTDSDANVLTADYTILEPAILTANINSTNDVGCNGTPGSATVSVSGGTAPYTYLWSNGMTTSTATNLLAGNYSVSVTDANGCVANTSVIISQISPLIINETISNVSCFGLSDGTISLNVSGGSGNYTYSWSNAQTTSSISNLGVGTYTVVVSDGLNCSETKTYTITQPALVYPPVAFNQSFCIGQNSTLADVIATGTNLKWYTSATGGSVLPNTTVLSNNVTYYVSQTVGVCESTRTAVQITLTQGTPLTTSQLNVCNNSRIQNLTIDMLNYTQLKWYDTATSTTPLASSQLLTSKTYYVSSFVSNCESVRKPIQVTVLGVVNPPVVSAQTVCSNTTLDDLVITTDPGATLKWFNSLQSITPLAGNTIVSTGTYYVQQIISNCESTKVPVQVQVINVTKPSLTNITTCEGITIADFSAGTNYVWYTDNVSINPLSPATVITPGVYYIANEVTGCYSQRVSVTVVVNSRPNSPTGMSKQSFGFSATVSDLIMNEPNVRWFLTYQDAIMQVNELAGYTPLQKGTIYYGILTGVNNCGSLPTPVEVTEVLDNHSFDLSKLNYYPNPVENELTINYSQEIVKIEVYSMNGQRLVNKEFNNREVKVDLSAISSGNYMLKIYTENTMQFVKIIKK